MAGIDVLFLSRQDIDALELDLRDILDAVEVGLEAHGNKKVIMPSTGHLVLDFPEKLFNILKGYVEPVDAAGVKVIGDFQKNFPNVKLRLKVSNTVGIVHMVENNEVDVGISKPGDDVLRR